MRGTIKVLLLTFLLAAHVVVLGKTSEAWKSLPRGDSATSVVMPATLLRIVSLEFDGLMSDYLFLKAIVFIGEHLEQDRSLRELSEQKWKWVHHIFDVASGLDPYFIDPYYVGNAYLTWDGGMVGEANNLLEKGSRYRDWDWSLPFFIGFNHFYFLQDNDKASEYLMEASRRPGASPILASLASKMAFKAKRTENSIVFLEEILKKTDDESLRKQYETRIEALRAVLLLEKAVDVYWKRFGRAPRELDDLIQKGIIEEIPADPYGGRFFIDNKGAVKTTSEYLLVPARRGK